MFVQNQQEIRLSLDEAKAALIEGLRKQHKKLIPAALDLEAVNLTVSAEDNEMQSFNLVLPPAKASIGTAEKPAE